MFKRIWQQAGGVLLEMTLSVTALILLFGGMMDVSDKISRQNNLNTITQELETVMRGASVTSGSSPLLDVNSHIRNIHYDLNLVLQKLFTKHSENFSKYEARAGIFVYEMPESESPVFYLWLGIKGIDASYLKAKPCVKLMAPVEIDYGGSYLVDAPASDDPENIIFTYAQAQSNILNNSDPYTFFEITDEDVAEATDDFC